MTWALKKNKCKSEKIEVKFAKFDYVSTRSNKSECFEYFQQCLFLWLFQWFTVNVFFIHRSSLSRRWESTNECASGLFALFWIFIIRFNSWCAILAEAFLNSLLMKISKTQPKTSPKCFHNNGTIRPKWSKISYVIHRIVFDSLAPFVKFVALKWMDSNDFACLNSFKQAVRL